MIDNIHVKNILGYYQLLGLDGFPICLSEAIEFIKSSNFKGIKNTCVIRQQKNDIEFEEIFLKSVPEDIEIKLYDTFIQIVKLILKEVKTIERDPTNKHIISKYRQYLLASFVYLRQMAVSPLIPFSKASLDSSDFKNRSYLADLINQQLRNDNLLEALEDESIIYSSRIKACIEQLKINTERVVIFSSFRVTLDLLTYCIRNKLPNRLILTIDSEMSVKQRQDTLALFRQTDNAILLLTYACGSVGLNLQVANIIYILDHSWSAIATKQALQRVIRFGQTRKCFVYYFSSCLSIEESILDKQIAKLDIGKGLMDGEQELIKGDTNQIHIKEIMTSMIQDYESQDKIQLITSKLNNL